MIYYLFDVNEAKLTQAYEPKIDLMQKNIRFYSTFFHHFRRLDCLIPLIIDKNNILTEENPCFYLKKYKKPPIYS